MNIASNKISMLFTTWNSPGLFSKEQLFSTDSFQQVKFLLSKFESKRYPCSHSSLHHRIVCNSLFRVNHFWLLLETFSKDQNENFDASKDLLLTNESCMQHISETSGKKKIAIAANQTCGCGKMMQSELQRSNLMLLQWKSRRELIHSIHCCKGKNLAEKIARCNGNF